MTEKCRNSNPSSFLRAAFDRFSFRSRRNKEIKYDIVIEQKQKADVDTNETNYDVLSQVNCVLHLINIISLQKESINNK